MPGPKNGKKKKNGERKREKKGERKKNRRSEKGKLEEIEIGIEGTEMMTGEIEIESRMYFSFYIFFCYVCFFLNFISTLNSFCKEVLSFVVFFFRVYKKKIIRHFERHERTNPS